MDKSIGNIHLLDILPPNLQKSSKVSAAAQALDGELKSVTMTIAECLILPRLDELPEPVLDLLAWQWHVDFYEPAGLNIAKKRELIRQSIAWHRHKGTPWAVEQVVTAAVADATIHEWFEYGGEPGMFRIETGGFKSENTFKDLIQAIHVAKNTRSHLDRIIINGNKNELNNENVIKQNIGLLNCLRGYKQIQISLPEKSNMVMHVGQVQICSGRKKVQIERPTVAVQKTFVGQIIRRTGRITIGGAR